MNANCESETKIWQNVVLIDGENVPIESFDSLKLPSAKILVFLGEKQSFTSRTVAAVHRITYDSECIVCERVGKDELDFLIIFYVGRLSLQIPSPIFHVVSTDHDFAALVEHLKGLKIRMRRWKSVSDLCGNSSRTFKMPGSPDEVSQDMVSFMKQMLTEKRRLQLTTPKAIADEFRRCSPEKLSRAKINGVVRVLRDGGFLSIKGGVVSYPDTKPQS